MDERPIPIVHRIIRVHEKEDSSVDVLTKVSSSVRCHAVCHHISGVHAETRPGLATRLPALTLGSAFALSYRLLSGTADAKHVAVSRT